MKITMLNDRLSCGLRPAKKH